MASIRDRVFTDDEIQGLIGMAYAQASYALGRNRQEHYERYESLATALQQVVTERNQLREGASHARSPESEKGPDPSGLEPGEAPQRKRVRRVERPGSV